jgi:hypothetical protein
MESHSKMKKSTLDMGMLGIIPAMKFLEQMDVSLKFIPQLASYWLATTLILPKAEDNTSTFLSYQLGKIQAAPEMLGIMQESYTSTFAGPTQSIKY